MNKVFKIMLLGIVFLSSIYSALAVIDMLSFEASLFVDSSNDFIDNVASRKVDIVLGGKGI